MLQQVSRQSLTAIRLLVVMTVLLGVVYPAVVWLAGRAFAGTADGRLVESGGDVVGSAIIGQEFAGAEWFHSRPSAVGWDGLASAPSNLGPSNQDLLDQIAERRVAVAQEEGVDPADVPPDALTTSASGLDPYISPDYAALQVARVARERGLDAATVQGLVDDQEQGRQLGFLGEPKVNVLLLNIALEQAD